MRSFVLLSLVLCVAVAVATPHIKREDDGMYFRDERATEDDTLAVLASERPGNYSQNTIYTTKPTWQTEVNSDVTLSEISHGHAPAKDYIVIEILKPIVQQVPFNQSEPSKLWCSN